jgi:hypothetical protein
MDYPGSLITHSRKRNMLLIRKAQFDVLGAALKRNNADDLEDRLVRDLAENHPESSRRIRSQKVHPPGHRNRREAPN